MNGVDQQPAPIKWCIAEFDRIKETHDGLCDLLEKTFEVICGLEKRIIVLEKQGQAAAGQRGGTQDLAPGHSNTESAETATENNTKSRT